jgi:hypothetical protein
MVTGWRINMVVRKVWVSSIRRVGDWLIVPHPVLKPVLEVNYIRIIKLLPTENGGFRLHTP